MVSLRAPETMGRVAAVVSAAFALMACSGSNNKSSTCSAVKPLDPTASHYGKTYAEWNAAWWKWYFQLQEPSGAATNSKLCVDPIQDPSGAQCQSGQDPNSPVFFLTGNFGGTSVRDQCAVPKGKAIFFPILNWEADNVGVAPGQVESAAGLKGECDATEKAVDVSSLKASVDCENIPHLDQYVSGQQSFTYTVPAEPNIYTCNGVTGISGVVQPAYAGGFSVLLPPLPPGKHTIHFSGTRKQSPQDFTLDVTYHLTIE